MFSLGIQSTQAQPLYCVLSFSCLLTLPLSPVSTLTVSNTEMIVSKMAVLPSVLICSVLQLWLGHADGRHTRQHVFTGLSSFERRPQTPRSCIRRPCENQQVQPPPPAQSPLPATPVAVCDPTECIHACSKALWMPKWPWRLLRKRVTEVLES